ncbi:rCG46188 [Rattus norvegicus]|uniref:RCG46188 n=1 Tax=Rattus norvegicus TaxID=10116 RepID=A6IDP8_RAT|nr:rCG46188 [Rattus norvegicus]
MGKGRRQRRISRPVFLNFIDSVV